MRKVSATGKAIATPELLRLICEYCSNRENHHNALVSKTWSNEALNILWHSLDSLAPLLSLLAPLKIGEDSCYEFERHIRPSDWVVFKKYSWRVHIIRSDYNTDFDLATSAFVDLASSRPCNDLLPNLRRLYYTDNKLSFRFIPLFIPTYLTFIDLSLMFKLTDAHRAICKEILSYLPEKAACLEHLRLSSLDGVTAHDAEALQLAQVISALPKLKTVDIMDSFLIPECLHSLAHLQYLEVLTLLAHDYTEPSLIITPSPNTFPSLTHFSTYRHTHGDIIRFLDTCKPRALRSLFVKGRDDGASLPDLCRVAGSVCPGLRCLSLGNATMHHSNHCNPDLIVPENYFSMVYDHLNLTSLSLDKLPPSSLNMKTIIDLLRGLPLLRKLSLRTRHCHPPTLPISCLAEFAPFCPQMEELALCVETSLVPGEPAAYRTEPEGFKSLKILDVGRSALKSSAFRVTSFLSTILPEACRLSYSHIYVYDPLHVPCRSDICRCWHSVVDFLPLMFRMRRAERLLATERVKA